MNVMKEEDIDLARIAEALKSGQTLVYPTETCYGLGCDALNESAVQKVFSIKKRQAQKSVLVVAAHVSMMREFVQWDPMLDSLANRYWPGPLTVVAPCLSGISVPQGIVGPDNTIAFRVTDHPLAHELSAKLGRPLVSTSANIASHESPYDIQSVLSMFEDMVDQPDMVIDSGILPHKSPSTIVKVKDGNIVTLRQGEIIIND